MSNRLYFALVSILIMFAGLFPACRNEKAATSSQQPANTDIKAAPQRPSSIEITPPSILLPAKGATGRFEILVKDKSGKEIKTPREVAWKIDRPEVAIVDSSGLITALSPGKAQLTVTCGTVSETSEVEVRYFSYFAIQPEEPTVSVPGILQLEAVLKDENGKVVKDVKINWADDWKTDGPRALALASINISGQVYAKREGTVTAKAEVAPNFFATTPIQLIEDGVGDETDYSFPAMRALPLSTLMRFAAEEEITIKNKKGPVPISTWKAMLAARAILLKPDLAPDIEKYLDDQDERVRRVAACIIKASQIGGALKEIDLSKHIKDTPAFRATFANMVMIRLLRIEDIGRDKYNETLDKKIGDLPHD